MKKKLNPDAKKSELYFGYGANLSIDRFMARKINMQEVGNTVLLDHQLRFSLANEYQSKGYAGVHPCTGQQTWGVLYGIDKLSLKLLDALE